MSSTHYQHHKGYSSLQTHLPLRGIIRCQMMHWCNRLLSTWVVFWIQIKLIVASIAAIHSETIFLSDCPGVMHEADSNGEEEEEFIFSCRIESSKTISEILTCLCMNRKDHICYIGATPESLMFAVTGKAKSTQARVNLEADLFDDYMCDSPSIRLALNLNMLLDCLEIFGSSSGTTATMTYSVSKLIFQISYYWLNITLLILAID